MPRDYSNKLPVAIKHKQQILERLSQGERISDIGHSLGISRTAISNQLANDPDFQSARILALDSRMERWEKEIEGIGPDDSMVTLARSKELLSQARWRAEREAPHIWGAKQQVQVSQVSIEDRMPFNASTLIDAIQGKRQEPRLLESQEPTADGDTEK